MDTLLSIMKNDAMSKERWESIQQCKRNFLLNDCENHLNNPQLNPAIAASWIRSRSMGVDPYNEIVGLPLSPKDYEGILEKNRILIEIAKPLVNIYKDLMISSDYNLELIDSNGVSLLQEGESSIHPWEGTIFDEATMGTNAHSLSMELKHPVQLFGPEHYCLTLQNIVATAAPIMDKFGKPMASLALTQPLKNPPWEDQKPLSHTLGLITAMAAAVEAQLRLRESYEQLIFSNDCLKTAYDTIEATLACVDEGIITVDKNGQILRVNQEGMRMLRLKPEEIGQKSIMKFLNARSSIMSMAASGESASIEETFFFDNDDQPYMVNIHPVLNHSNGQLDVAVLRLTPIEKINSMVTSRSGATASFHFEDIIGESKALKKAIEMGQRFARSQENILLIGESGTGKELFAQSIHNLHRPTGPFMAVNCAAMPRELIESELFGYEGGSFTGAERSGRPGKIELAQGGTLFLDEIGDMPLELQAVLLRVLEDKQIMRIGGRRYKKVDFRLIAATNKPLEEMAKEKLFREDLYFRLSVLSIQLPPLRNREQDAELLSGYFIRKYCKKVGSKLRTLSPEAQKIIMAYNWPGNIRQLESAMSFALNMTQSDVIELNDLPEYLISTKNPVKINLIATDEEKTEETLSLRKLEKSAIDLALIHAHNSIPRAAALLGISKATLYRKLKEYNYDQL